MTAAFDADCTFCPRLTAHRRALREHYPGYHNAPVAAFGAADPKLLIVGLAPGLHGANATGRPFTGDYAGILLYATLYKLGLANQAGSVSADDSLRLDSVRITNAVKCLPPANKPTTKEADTCRRYLATEIVALPDDSVVLALGLVAHRAVVKSSGAKLIAYPFAHAAEHVLPGGRVLIDSYHCSRYNTQTGRLTAAMFEDVVARAWSVALA